MEAADNGRLPTGTLPLIPQRDFYDGQTNSELQDGDPIIFKLSQNHWTAHVKHATGGISGRVVPFKSFDEALAVIREDNEL